MSSTSLFRNYIDIINENSQPKVQLNEGLMDTIKSLVPKAMKLFGGDTVAKIAQQVKQVTGGDFTPSTENAIKVATALGFDKLVKEKEGQTAESVVEAWGVAGNWQGKLIQLAYTATVSAGMFAGFTGAGGPWAGRLLAVIGMLLLMFADTFFSTDRGMVGAMGRNGRQGFDTGMKG